MTGINTSSIFTHTVLVSPDFFFHWCFLWNKSQLETLVQSLVHKAEIEREPLTCWLTVMELNMKTVRAEVHVDRDRMRPYSSWNSCRILSGSWCLREWMHVKNNNNWWVKFAPLHDGNFFNLRCWTIKFSVKLFLKTNDCRALNRWTLNSDLMLWRLLLFFLYCLY